MENFNPEHNLQFDMAIMCKISIGKKTNICSSQMLEIFCPVIQGKVLSATLSESSMFLRHQFFVLLMSRDIILKSQALMDKQLVSLIVTVKLCSNFWEAFEHLHKIFREVSSSS